jgi:5-methylcytosine-specific restriction protein A
MSTIGMYNKYKAGIFEKAYDQKDYYEEKSVIYFRCDAPAHVGSNMFDERINYYSSVIYGKTISESEAEEYRIFLGFNDKPTTLRDVALTELIRNNTPDECVCCKNKYDIKDRTFIHRKTGKPYFEIHHAISLGNNVELDDENNLVKLCPVCHDCLKKGVGTEEAQKELITELLNNSPQVKEFAEHIFDTSDFNMIVQLMFENLK